MTDWTDSRRFWAETCRTAIFGAIAAFAALLIFNHYSEVDKVRIDKKTEVIDDFLAVSHDYTVAAEAFCSGNPSVVTDFESKDIDRYRLSRERLALYFGGNRLGPDLDAVDVGEQKLFKECNTPGHGKSEWEPMRQELIAANKKLAQTATNAMGSPF